MTLDEKSVRAIGEIVVHYQTAEFILCDLVWRVLGVEREIGEAITSQLPFRGTLNLARKLIRLRWTAQPALVERFDGIAFEKAEETRNKMVHSSWAADAGAFARVKQSKTAMKTQVHSCSLQDLEKAAAELKALSDEVFAVFQQAHQKKLISA